MIWTLTQLGLPDPPSQKKVIAIRRMIERLGTNTREEFSLRQRCYTLASVEVILRHVSLYRRLTYSIEIHLSTYRKSVTLRFSPTSSSTLIMEPSSVLGPGMPTAGVMRFQVTFLVQWFASTPLELIRTSMSMSPVWSDSHLIKKLHQSSPSTGLPGKISCLASFIISLSKMEPTTLGTC